VTSNPHPFARSGKPVDPRWSTRPSHEPPEPPRIYTADSIDKIFRQAEQAQRAQQQPGKDSTMTATGPLSDLHGPRDVANRIKGLADAGVAQLTRADLKAMKPEEIVQAQRDGRLLQAMSGIDPYADDRAAYQRGRQDMNNAWIKALDSDEDNDS
jgi:hypothetical protein